MPTIKTKKKRKSHNHKKRPFYQSKAWKLARKLCLTLNPFCVHCAMRGGKVKATTADHVKSPWLENGALTDQMNLQSLCRSCHNSKSARDSNKHRKK